MNSTLSWIFSFHLLLSCFTVSAMSSNTTSSGTVIATIGVSTGGMVSFHFYKKRISKELITHAKRFLRWYKYRFCNWWCGNIARGNFRNGYPSWNLTFREGYLSRKPIFHESYTENSLKRPVSARVIRQFFYFILNMYWNLHFSHGLPNPVILIMAHLLKT